MNEKTLKDKLSKTEESFEALKRQEETLLAQAKELNQKLAQTREEMVRVQGDYRTLTGLIEDLGKKEEKK